MAVQTKTKRIVSMMRNDSRYKKLKAVFDTNPIYNISADNLIEEVKTIHKLREIRRLNPREEKFARKVVESNTHDQAQRSRITEIMMSCVHITNKLEEAIKALRYHFLLEYSEHLKQFRTKEEKSLVISMAMRGFSRYLSDVKTVRDMAELVLKDIDQGAWSTKSNIAVLELKTKRESHV